MGANEILARARTFLWSNARLLERRRYAYLFEDGSRDGVLRALDAYRNPSGGYGHALEPDKRCSESQPIDQQVALQVLGEVGLEANRTSEVCAFLESITTDEGGIPFVLPSVRSAPRAPWWNTDDDPPAALTPTAGIAGLLHRNGVAHPWLDRASDYCWMAIEEIGMGEVHDVMSAFAFLEHAPDRERAEAELQRLARTALEHHVERDPYAPGYVHKVLDFAPTPSSWCRRAFPEVLVEEHLDAMAAAQNDDGGWPIAWPPVSPGCELEYRGMVTLNALETLRAYGRLG